MTEPDKETLKLINDEIKGRLERQDSSSARLDGKLTFVLGFVVAGIPILLANKIELISGALAIAALALVVLLAIDGLRPHHWEVVPEPRPLVDEFGRKSAPETLGALIGTRVVAYERNRKIARRKSRRLNQSIVVLLVAVTISGISLQIGRNTNGSKPASPIGQRPASTSTPTYK